MDASKGELTHGGLALVYGLVEKVEFNGVIVTLVCPLGEEYPDRSTWRECHLESDWVCEFRDTTELFNSANLMPINPEADPLHSEDLQSCLQK